MLRPMLQAAAVIGTLGVTPSLAQLPAPAPLEQVEANLVGLPVYSSDGQKLGSVVEVGSFGGERMLRAEIESFLGLGVSPVLIPQDMFVHKVDRVEVAMTAKEIMALMHKQQQQPQSLPQPPMER
jgi:ribosomal 30S subunit maturation factor RimM